MVERPEGDVEQIAEPEEPDQPDQVDHSIPAEEVQAEQLESLPAESPVVSQPAETADSLLDELSAAIEHYPDAPANYVLRGELYLDEGQIALAAQDFQRALELADPLAESATWGYINEALADRAREGLRHCQ